MPFALLPAIRVETITQLRPQDLTDRGIRLLMLDFDNTLVPYTTDIPTDRVLAWLEKMRNSPVMLCVVSNSKRPRVQEFCRKYGLACITHARKPGTQGIRRCMEEYGVKPGECALAGDQIYTDTLGANRAGITSILVDAIHDHTIWLKLRHIAELPFRMAAEKRRIYHEES